MNSESLRHQTHSEQHLGLNHGPGPESLQETSPHQQKRDANPEVCVPTVECHSLLKSRFEPANLDQIANRRREKGAVEIGPFEVGIVSAGIGFKFTDDSGEVPQLPEAQPPLPQLPEAQPPEPHELQEVGQTVSGTNLQTS